MTNKRHVNELVVNWHVTEACNYGCKFCYSKWQRHGQRDTWKSRDQSEMLLQEVASFFAPDNTENPLTGTLTWDRLRLSIAGGEPTLLGERLVDIVDQAGALEMGVSIISNGSRLDLLERIIPKLDLLGLSIDSLDQATNHTIGRKDRSGRGLGLQELLSFCSRLRTLPRAPVLKFNTVVNAANMKEDFSAFIESSKPDRWKILRMLPSTTHELEVSTQAFERFVKRHRRYSPIMTVEDNNHMKRSYIMIDPLGRFFQNGGQQMGYTYSAPIINAGAAAAFQDIIFYADRFAERYSGLQQEGAA